MALPRIAPKGGIEIGGVTFPEGTTVGINPWVFHRDKDIWGQDADEFKPERWLVEDAAGLDKYFIPVSPRPVGPLVGAFKHYSPGSFH